jgi:ribosomal protein S18 acetylase RimI-like enzyme
MKIREIAFGSSEHARTIALRSRILREPLGLRFTPEELALEHADVHLGAFESQGGGESLVGCLVLVRLTPKTAKMRQVAVEPTLQRSGIGRSLVAECERAARKRGYERIELHARDTAVAFYLALGYRADGPEFTELGIAHQKLVKDLD